MEKKKFRDTRVQSIDMQKYEGEEDFINKKFDEICFHGNLSAEEEIYFLFSFFTVYFFLLVF